MSFAGSGGLSPVRLEKGMADFSFVDIKSADAEAPKTEAAADKSADSSAATASNGNFKLNIKVIGVGGGGENSVDYMMSHEVEGVEFIVANTDAQVLERSKVGKKIQLGRNLTGGLGAGGNPDIGKQAAEEDTKAIEDAIGDANMLFIAAGMGGGTGTGAAPIIANLARKKGILTVGIVTKPFSFEGKKRMNYAVDGIAKLSKEVDSLITIPNEKLSKALGRTISIVNAFDAANEILYKSVKAISDLVTRPGQINIDFQDVTMVMKNAGTALIGVAEAKGEDRAEKAAKEAIASPLLETVDLNGARGIIVNVAGNSDIGLAEYQTVSERIQSFAADNANIKVGVTIDDTLEDDVVRVTAIVTGIGQCDVITKLPESGRPAAQPQQNDFGGIKAAPAAGLGGSGVEIPAYVRNSQSGNTVLKAESGVEAEVGFKLDRDNIATPAFLRHQSD